MIKLTPRRLDEVMKEANRLRAEDALTLLACVNRGLAGGDAYRRFHRKLCRRAGIRD